jgi:molecular chaperone DnaJ
MDFDPSKDYYSILGVAKNASADEIKSVFRKSAMKYHPDHQTGKSDAEKKEAETKFKEINEAYEVLSDDEKRRQYEQIRALGGRPHMGGFGFGGMPHGFSHMRGFGMGGFDPFGDDESDYNSVKQKPTVEPEQGPVAKTVINVSFEEAIYGVDGKPFKANVYRECSHCHGLGGSDDWVKCSHCGGTGWIKSIRGMMTQISNCQHCHGTGWVRSSNCNYCNGNGVVLETHDFTVNIPKGSMNGTMLRLAGAGHNGMYNGPRGDLIVLIQVADSDRYIVSDNGETLGTIHKISPVTAILGSDKEEVVTPWGICEVKIPKGCANGTKLRLKGQGAYRREYNDYGDLYVIILIDIPEDFDKKDLKKMEEFKKWYEKSSLSKSINSSKQNDAKYMEEIKSKFDIKR